MRFSEVNPATPHLASVAMPLVSESYGDEGFYIAEWLGFYAEGGYASLTVACIDGVYGAWRLVAAYFPPFPYDNGAGIKDVYNFEWSRGPIVLDDEILGVGIPTVYRVYEHEGLAERFPDATVPLSF